MDKLKFEKILQNLKEINEEVLKNLDNDIDDLRRANTAMMKEIIEEIHKSEVKSK